MVHTKVRAMNHLIDRGWAFYWGTSEWSAADIIHAHGIAKQLGLVGPMMEQPLYNLFNRARVETEYGAAVDPGPIHSPDV